MSDPPDLLPGSYWHFSVVGPHNRLFWNARLSKGVVQSTSFLVDRNPELAGAVNPNDVEPMLGPMEPVLEDVRVAEFPGKPRRRGAFYVFEDLDYCRAAGRVWGRGAPFEVVEARIFQGSVVHRGHLPWLDETANWEAASRNYWAGSEHPTRGGWETVIYGAVYMPGWREPPFGRW